MSRYLMRRVVYEPVEVDEGDLVSVVDAARRLGITMPGVIAAINRDELAEVVDEEAPHRRQNRRFVLRSSVEEAVEARGR